MRVFRRGLCAVGWVAACAWAGGPLRLETSLEPREATVGDPVHLTIKAVAEAGVTVRPFAAEKALGVFDVLSFTPDAPREEDGSLTQTFHWTLAAYEVGVATVPALTFAYQSQGAVEEIQTQPLTVAIQSVLGQESQDIRGLKKLWRGRPPWLLYALGALLLTLGIVGGILWSRRRRMFRSVPPRPAHEGALASLARLAENPPGSVKLFYSELSNILRAYLAGRYGFPAVDLTTSEIMTVIKKRGMLSDSRLTARQLLESSDLVKFAKMDPGEEERLRHLSLAKAFVLATRPIDPSPEDA